MPKFIVIFGNPVEGLLYMRPYNNFAEAAEGMPSEGDWWIAGLIDPSDMTDHSLPRLTERLVRTS